MKNNTFTFKFTEGSCKLFGYHPGVQIGPIKINKILREYRVYNYEEKDYKYPVSPWDDGVKSVGLKQVKIIEFNCSYIE